MCRVNTRVKGYRVRIMLNVRQQDWGPFEFLHNSFIGCVNVKCHYDPACHTGKIMRKFDL